jgi:hypothetical protein
MKINLLNEPYAMVQSNWPYKLMWWSGLTVLTYQSDQKNCNPVNFNRQQYHYDRPDLPKHTIL